MTTKCISCGKPAATKVHLRYCWSCYWKQRPEAYQKKLEYQKKYDKLKRATNV